MKGAAQAAQSRCRVQLTQVRRKEHGCQSINSTVIVTCFNHQAFVEQCLASIAAESIRPRQVTIVDDASTNDSLETIRHWMARNAFPATLIIRDRNGGIRAAMNDALAHSKVASIRHVSASDWLLPDELSGHLRTLLHAPESVGSVVGDVGA